MNTLQMEIAMMKHIGVRQNCVVPNVSWGIAGLHECDLLSLSLSGYATEIEIKISKADLIKDKKKSHGHEHNHIKYLMFAVPEKLEEIAMEHIPERAGLYIVSQYHINYDLYPEARNTPYNRIKYRVKIARGCTANKTAHKWSDKERLDLFRLGTMRILGLKESVAKLKHKVNV